MNYTFYTQSLILIIYFLSYIYIKKSGEWTPDKGERFFLAFFKIDGILYALSYILTMFLSLFNGKWYDYIIYFITTAIFIYGFKFTKSKE